MIAVRVTYEDGNTIDTEINATLEEARAYYIGQSFNFGDSHTHPEDNLVKAVRVDLLDNEDNYEKWKANAREEYNQKFGQDPDLIVEFSENGDAYPHGIGGIGHIRKCVTPYK